MGAESAPTFTIWGRKAPPEFKNGSILRPRFFEIWNLNKITMKSEHKKWGQLSAPTKEILLKYSLDLPYTQTGIYFLLVVMRSNKHPIKNPMRVPQVFIITSSNCANLPINVCKNSMPIENTAPSITPFHQCL